MKASSLLANQEYNSQIFFFYNNYILVLYLNLFACRQEVIQVIKLKKYLFETYLHRDKKELNVFHNSTIFIKYKSSKSSIP